MWEGLGHQERALRFRGAELAEKEAATRFGEEAVALHLAPGLPMRRAEACESIAEKRNAQHQCCDAEAREDQVHPEEVARGGGPKRAVFPCEQGDVEGLRRQAVTDGQVARGHDIADCETDQRQAQDPACDLPLIHG